MCSEACVCILAVYRESWQTTDMALIFLGGFVGFCHVLNALNHY